jgi:threonine dehydrogenase-like Zn-dependent dehydrogenase
VLEVGKASVGVRSRYRSQGENNTPALCPCGRLRLCRLLRFLETDRIDPTHLTTHEFSFDEVDRGFELIDSKAETVVTPLITFDEKDG